MVESSAPSRTATSTRSSRPEACLREDALVPRPVYRHAALDALTRLG